MLSLEYLLVAILCIIWKFDFVVTIFNKFLPSKNNFFTKYLLLNFKTFYRTVNNIFVLFCLKYGKSMYWILSTVNIYLIVNTRDNLNI